MDVMNDPGYSHGAQAIENYRTIIGVPLMRNGQAIGVFSLWRHHVEPFSPRQIALVETFADQAVIAIENVRLFTALDVRNRELTESLEQQTATGEILRVISSSPTDAQPVFDTIAQAVLRLCLCLLMHPLVGPPYESALLSALAVLALQPPAGSAPYGPVTAASPPAAASGFR